jgi:outer membrane protein OmpA-like peptidoglycan-associated protein
MIPRAATLLLILLAAPAQALDLPLPAQATLAAEETAALDSLSLPVGPWRDGKIDVHEPEGAVTRQAWRLPASALTTLQMIAPLRTALEEAGYEILYECRDEECGGFDFRYRLPLLPEPAMHVDLGDFRYLAAAPKDGDAPDFVSLTVSRGADGGYVHITRVGDPPTVVPDETPVAVPLPAAAEAPPEEPPDAAPETLGSALETDGHVVLDDLRFATGATALEDTLFPSLVALADWLNKRPEARVVLVGHSDVVGGLDTNIGLSRSRAQSVVDRLVTAHGVAPGQISAEGVGFLAPRSDNATREGRAANRRVEAVLANPS